MRDQTLNEPRYVYLMRVAAEFISQVAADKPAFYNNRDVDGYVLAEELLRESNNLEEELLELRECLDEV